MQRSRMRIRPRLLTLILLLVLPSVVLLPSRALAQSALAQSALDHQLQTKYFTTNYPKGEQETASWYAGFADDVDASVSELLGQDPVTGIILSIFDTEADYRSANPSAASEPGIIVQDLSSAFTVTGIIAFGVGILVVLVGTTVIVRSRRRKSMSPCRFAGEESASWL